MGRRQIGKLWRGERGIIYPYLYDASTNWSPWNKIQEVVV